MKVVIIYKDEKKWKPSKILNVTKIKECSYGVDITFNGIVGFYASKLIKEIKIEL